MASLHSSHCIILCCRADVGLASLLEGFKQQQTRHAQAAWTASQLQLQLPADADRWT